MLLDNVALWKVSQKHFNDQICFYVFIYLFIYLFIFFLLPFSLTDTDNAYSWSIQQ